MTTSDSAERDKPEDLTIEELRAIEIVIRGAINRASRRVGNVINLEAHRTAARAKLRPLHA